MSNELVSQIRTLFDSIDDNKSGDIDEIEFYKSFIKIGVNISGQEAKELFEEYDADKSGTIEFDEFKSMIEKKLANDVLVFDDIISEVR